MEKIKGLEKEGISRLGRVREKNYGGKESKAGDEGGVKTCRRRPQIER